MSKKSAGLFIGFLLLSILMGAVNSAKAQTAFQTTAIPVTPLVAATQIPENLPFDSNVVTFARLQWGELHLVGSYDAARLSFAPPANWQLSQGAELNLSMAVSFNSAQNTQDRDNLPITVGGTLSVFFNDVLLGALPMQGVGEIETKLPIPVEAYESKRSDGRMEITFVLDSTISCLANQQMNIFIHSGSYFTLPHSIIKPNVNLADFPEPIYQNSFVEDVALLVLPDNPTASELQAAFTLGAGLTNISRNHLSLDMTTLNKISPDVLSKSHVIFVGKATSLPILSQLTMPLDISANGFSIENGGEDDGVIELINSPWNSSQSILVVSGNTDLGVVRASQAISTGIIRPNKFPNLAVIQEVQAATPSSLQPTDQTLSDLGYQDEVFSSRGLDSVSYTFSIPPGWTPSLEAYFELAYGHSALLDYDRSAIVVLLNGQPISSIKMNSTSASQSINRVRIAIPPTATIPGKNVLEVQINLVPVDDCAPPDMQGLWARIWPSSAFHLPLSPVSIRPNSSIDLALYPAPFIFHTTLGDTAFVVQRNDLESWRSALKIASLLGYQSNSPLITMSVFYSEEVPLSERSKYNFLIVGRPSQLKILGEINDNLPAPFLNGSDIPVENGFQVQFRIDPSSPMGYLELLSSPWNNDNVVLALLGNTSEAVTWTTSALLESNLSWQLKGNFAVVNNRQIVSTDTRVISFTDIGTPAGTSATQAQPQPNDTTVTPQTTLEEDQNWVLPALLISVLLVIIISLGLLFSRNRS